MKVAADSSAAAAWSVLEAIHAMPFSRSLNGDQASVLGMSVHNLSGPRPERA
jgi:hypothetical protein